MTYRERKAWMVSAAVGAAAALGAAPALADLPARWNSTPIENPTPQINDRFGDGIVNVGDADGDGEDDFLVGIDEHATIPGELHLFSGATGALIRSTQPPDPDPGGAGDNPDAFGTYVGKIADIGSCPDFAGDPGDDCAAPTPAIDAGDGVPDHLASAIGVDVDADGDDMGMAYVLDGATGAVLKRITMPPAHRDEQAANSPTASQGGGFGRTILAPSGRAPCEGFGGVGPCPPTEPAAVRDGDMDGGGTPDIGIGSSDFTDREKDFTDPGNAAANPVCDDDDDPATVGSVTAVCFQTGRYFVYRGEDLAGLAPNQPLDSALYVIKNPYSQVDRPDQNTRFAREAMAYSVAPVGDLGRCLDTTIEPGVLCLNADGIGDDNTTTPDGRPDFIVSNHRWDMGELGDTGMALAIDGPTGHVLDIYIHPEPQQAAIFAFSNYNQPAIGDVGSSTAPDVYQAAMIQDVFHFAQGQGYVLSGDFRAGGANHYRISTLDDPTPNKIGNFGTSSAGLGNVAGDSRNEVMIGAYGPHAPQVIDDVISDVHIFEPLHDQLLATIPDPDQQPGSGFGRALAPLGDVNDDGFIDFVVGAGGFGPGSCSPCPPGGSDPAQGRIYLFRSDNTAPPAARTIALDATKRKIRRGRASRLKGTVEAAGDLVACEAGQDVKLQRKRGTNPFRTFATVQSDAEGDFKKRVTPRRTAKYRARVQATSQCEAAVSNTVRIRVVRP